MEHGPPQLAGSEREVALAFLEYLRGELLRKLDGLSEAEARRSTVPSGTSVMGLVKHVTDVELTWVQWRFAGGTEPVEAVVGDDDTVESVTADALAAGEVVREIVTGVEDLGAPAAAQFGEPVLTLRWILAHLVQELARHAGHADIIREQLDGATGQ